jgi:ABC-type glycerol-3-phosphate transport system substrate-binding protein
MNTLRRIISIITVLTFATVGLWATGQGEDATQPADENTVFEYEIAEFTPGRDGENDLVTQWVEQEFNIRISEIPLAWSTVEEQWATFMAGGDQPEVITYDLQPFKMPTYQRWVQQGLLKPLPEDLSNYPHLADMRELMAADFEVLAYDGRDWGWPRYRGDMPGDGKTSGMKYIYRRDWARELGMDRDVWTIDQVLELAQAFEEQDPGQNGSGQTVGLAEAPHQFMEMFKGYNQPLANFEWKPNEERYVWTGYEEATVEAVVRMKEFYDSGGYEEDFFADNSNRFPDFRAGLIGILGWHVTPRQLQNFGEQMAETEGEDWNPTEDLGVLRIVGREGQHWADEWSSFWTVGLHNADMSDAKYERWLEVLNWLASPEGRDHHYFGMRGVDWRYSEDGSIERPNGNVELMWDTNEAGALVRPNRIIGMHRLVGLGQEFMQIDPSIDEAYRDEIWEFRDDKLAVPDGEWRYTEAFGELGYWSGEEKDRYASLGNDWYDMVRKLIVDTELEDIRDEYWNEIDSDFRNRVEVVLTEINEEFVPEH